MGLENFKETQDMPGGGLVVVRLTSCPWVITLELTP